MRCEGDVRIKLSRAELTAAREAIELTPHFEGRVTCATRCAPLFERGATASRSSARSPSGSCAGSSRSIFRPCFSGRSCSSPSRTPTAGVGAAAGDRRRRPRGVAPPYTDPLGGVPERSNGAVLKTVGRASVPWVRIPAPPLSHACPIVGLLASEAATVQPRRSPRVRTSRAHRQRHPQRGIRVDGAVYATLKTAFLLVLPSDE